MTRNTVPAVAVGAVTVVTSTIDTLLADLFHSSVVLAVLPGVLLGLWGGAAAAIMPWGEASWGAKKALRVVVLGMIVGTVAALALMDYPLTTIGPGRRLLYEFGAGFLAEQILQAGKVVGRESATRALRRARDLALRAATKTEGGGE